jgi:hypothetical protein
VLELLDSRRPDRGLALFVAQTRYQVVSISLEEDTPVLLNPLEGLDETVDAQVALRARPSLLVIVKRADRAYARMQAAVLDGTPPPETLYNRLEEIAGRAAEYREAAAGERGVREPTGRVVPKRVGTAQPVATRSTPEQLVELEERISALHERDFAVVLERYGYNLFAENCSTEIVRLLDASLVETGGLDGTFDTDWQPGEGLTFIPQRFYAKARGALPVAREELYPSHRRRALETMYAEEADVKVYLREFNVLSSTVYERRSRDGHFLLFTDDVFWPRPLYGAVNLGYALVRSGVGVLRAPLDGGDDVFAGAQGAFYSIPELVFFNMRKGTFHEAQLPEPPSE